MSHKTAAQLTTEINTDLPTNGANEITAADLRGVLLDLNDSVLNIPAGVAWRALVQQSATDGNAVFSAAQLTDADYNNTVFGASGAGGASAGVNPSRNTRDTAIGDGAGASIQINGNGVNTLVGADAGTSITTGGANVCLGRGASPNSGTLSNCTILGTGASSDGASAIAIGRDAQATAAHQLAIGAAGNKIGLADGSGLAVAAGASLGFLPINLNGTICKIEIFADS